jgi:hypothetical protein
MPASLKAPATPLAGEGVTGDHGATVLPRQIGPLFRQVRQPVAVVSAAPVQNDVDLPLSCGF